MNQNQLHPTDHLDKSSNNVCSDYTKYRVDNFHNREGLEEIQEHGGDGIQIRMVVIENAIGEYRQPTVPLK
jgi:hypothetical protein